MHTKRRQNNMGGGQGGGQHRHHNNRPRRFNNNRPQGDGNDPANVARTRRNATQNREKYQLMAHDATRAGDRVLAEYYLQHADHYHRVLLELPPEQIPPSQYLPRHNQQGDGQGEQQQAGDNGHAPQDGNNGHGHTHTHQDPMQSSAAALPSFITQPSTGNPEE